MKLNKFLFGFLILVLFFSFASAASSYIVSSSQFTNPTTTNSFLGFGSTPTVDINSQMCQQGQDFVLQISPTGCTPNVVRSDLLADQDVPVFCPIQMMKINPAVNIKSIESMTFGAGYPPEVSAIDFLPSYPALGINSQLTNGIWSNVGYAVIFLKRTINESSMPDYVTGNLTATVRYNAYDAFGSVDRTVYLPLINDQQFDSNAGKYSFFNNMGYLRADSIQNTLASISIYSGINQNRVSGTSVQKQKVLGYNLNVGESSPNFFLPGFGCFASSTLRLDAIGGADTRALIDVNGMPSELKNGETFLDGKCQVTGDPVKEGLRQTVPISCQADDGGKDFTFSIQPIINLKIVNSSGTYQGKYQVGDYIGMNHDGDKAVYLGYVGTDPKTSDTKITNSVAYFVTVPGTSKGKLDETTLTRVADIAENDLRQTKSISDFAKSILGTLAPIYDWLLDGNNFQKVTYGGLQEAFGTQVQILSFGVGTNLDLTDKTLINYHGNAVSDYEKLRSNFANEEYPPSGLKGVMGENALAQLVNLSSLLGQDEDLKKYCDDFKAKYPNSNLDVSQCNGIPKYSNAGVSTQTWLIGGDYKEISFDGITVPDFKSYGLELTVRKISTNQVTQFPIQMQKGDMIYLDSLFDSQTDTNQIFSMDKGVGDAKVYFKYDDTSKQWGWSVDQQNWMNTSTLVVNKGALLSGEKPTSAIQQLITSLNGLDFATGKAKILSKGNINDQEFIKLNNLVDQTHANLELSINKNLKSVGGIISVTGATLTSDNYNLELNIPKNLDGTDYTFTINKINLDRVAQVSVHTQIRDTSNVDFKFKIGIEKRSIQLSPDQIRSQIELFTGITNKLEDISNSLGKIVDVYQKACQAVGAFLTVKNLIFNSGTQAIARTQVMSGPGGWNAKCASLSGSGQEYSTQDQCLFDNSDKIETEVTQMTDAMNAQNDEIKRIEGLDGVTNSGGFLGQNIVDQKEEMKYFSDDIKKSLGDASSCIDPSINSDTLTVASNPESFNAGIYDLKTAQNIQLYSTLCAQNPTNENYKTQLNSLLKGIQVNYLNKEAQVNLQSSSLNLGLKNVIVRTYGDKNQIKGIYDGLTTPSNFGDIPEGTPLEPIVINNVAYYLTLKKIQDNQFIIDHVYNFDRKKVDDATELKIKSTFSSFEQSDPSVNTAIKNPEVKCYDTDPYKNLPAVVPIDAAHGWYVYVTQPTATITTTATTTSTGGYDASARVSNFWLCNAGSDGIMEYNPMSDDCSFITLGNTNTFHHDLLSDTDAASMVNKAVTDIQAVSQKCVTGAKNVRLDGKDYNIGQPEVNTPTIKCTDVMSPSDCQILFNACDPVICPSSRCNFGGQYPVKDVIQSGVIGSVVLCLPNVNQGVYVPVCLTGVKAGVDNWASVTRSYVSCLNTSLMTGQTVGICDEIYSVYGCQLLWQQSMPLLGLIAPKVENALSGNIGAVGGGEYLGGISGALKNADNSINYITQFYAVGAYNAFKARSQADVGTTVCKNAMSIAFPQGQGLLDTLGQSQSPPQFSGNFETIPFSSVTNPPQVQYKVYFHIFAGNDAPAYYQVYLKSSGSSYYNDAGLPRQVDSGTIPTGQSVDKTPDFTGPTGYDQLCIQVNNQEECGFGKVTTDFAANYLTQQYLKDQATTNSIQTADECISGDANLASLLNLNVQAGITNAVSPNLVAAGITRVCSSGNPGAKSDTTNTVNQRWVKVGTCGSQSISCWIDTESLKTAMNTQWITYNQTLDSLSTTLKNNLANQAGLMTEEQFQGNLTAILSQGDLLKRISMIQTIYDKVFGSDKKSYLLFIEGNAFKDLAVPLYNQLLNSGKVPCNSPNLCISSNNVCTSGGTFNSNTCKSGEVCCKGGTFSTKSGIPTVDQFADYTSNIYNYIEAPTSGTNYNYCYQFKQGIWYRAQKDTKGVCGIFTVTSGSVVDGKGFLEGVSTLVDRVKVDPSHRSLSAGKYVLGGDGNFNFKLLGGFSPPIFLTFSPEQNGWMIDWGIGEGLTNSDTSRVNVKIINDVNLVPIQNLTDKNLNKGAVVLFEGKGFSFSGEANVPNQNTPLTQTEITQLASLTSLHVVPYIESNYDYDFAYYPDKGWYVKYTSTFSATTSKGPISNSRESSWFSLASISPSTQEFSEVSNLISYLKSADQLSGIKEIVKESLGTLSLGNKEKNSELQYGDTILLANGNSKISNLDSVGTIYFVYDPSVGWKYGYDGTTWYVVGDIRQKDTRWGFDMTESEKNLVLSLNGKSQLDGEVAIFLYNSKTILGPSTGSLDLTNCVQYYNQIKTSANKYGIDANLLLAVIYQESLYNGIRCNSQAVSSSGPRGLMQFDSSTAFQYKLCSDSTCSSGDNRFDAQKSIDAGANYLSDLISVYKTKYPQDAESFALGAYNGGLGVINNAIGNVPQGQTVTWTTVSNQINNNLLKGFSVYKSLSESDLTKKVNEIKNYVSLIEGYKAQLTSLKWTSGSQTISNPSLDAFLQKIQAQEGQPVREASFCASADGSSNCYTNLMGAYENAGVKSFSCVYSEKDGTTFSISGGLVTVGPNGDKSSGGATLFSTNTKSCSALSFGTSKFDLLVPGDEIDFVYSTSSAHAVLFYSWIDKSKHLAKVFDWNGNKNSNGQKTYQFTQYDLSDNSHPILLIRKPIIS